MAQGCCPWTLARAYPPRTLRAQVLKKWPPSQLFLLHLLLQSIINLHWLFNLSNINTHFSKIKAYIIVIYFLMCIRKCKSNLPTNICTVMGKKTQWYAEKCDLLSETAFLPYIKYFLTVWCVLFYQSVCVFNQWCLSYFSPQHYVSMIFFIQCW